MFLKFAKDMITICWGVVLKLYFLITSKGIYYLLIPFISLLFSNFINQQFSTFFGPKWKGIKSPMNQEMEMDKHPLQTYLM